MKKKLYFGSNLKMYKNIQDTVSYLQDLVSLTKDISRDEIELFIIPSYTTLESATKNVDRSFVKLGAQNMCWEEQGQFRGRRRLFHHRHGHGLTPLALTLGPYRPYRQPYLFR